MKNRRSDESVERMGLAGADSARDFVLGNRDLFIFYFFGN
jgi:hypothetical protein